MHLSKLKLPVIFFKSFYIAEMCPLWGCSACVSTKAMIQLHICNHKSDISDASGSVRHSCEPTDMRETHCLSKAFPCGCRGSGWIPLNLFPINPSNWMSRKLNQACNMNGEFILAAFILVT